MKKLLAVSTFALLCITACNSDSKESSTTETSTSSSGDSTTAAPREQEIKDSTTMLDKKLADPNNKYSPDSTK